MRMMKTIMNLAPVRWASVHPRLAAWIVLSAGMVILLVIEAQNVGLLLGQWMALIAAVVLVAGACIWIISWEDADEDEAEPVSVTPAPQPEPAVAAAEAPASDSSANQG
jgi:4-hydroxybenzoate polyprenyltransferase